MLDLHCVILDQLWFTTWIDLSKNKYSYKIRIIILYIQLKTIYHCYMPNSKRHLNRQNFGEFSQMKIPRVKNFLWQFWLCNIKYFSSQKSLGMAPKMSCGTLAGLLPFPCDIWWHFPPPCEYLVFIALAQHFILLRLFYCILSAYHPHFIFLGGIYNLLLPTIALKATYYRERPITCSFEVSPNWETN